MSEVKVDERSTTRDERGQVLLDLSNAIVRIHKEYYGKGPTKARSHLTHDVVTVLLEGGFTRSEETLLAHGHQAEVIRARAALQDAVQQESRDAVEAILARRVRSFMSASDPAEALQVEVFVLEPGDAPPPADAQSELVDRARRARTQHQKILD